MYSLLIIVICVYKFNIYLVPSEFPSSPWGENAVEPTPKLETGWANFDSSFGEPMVTNGDSIIDQELFPDVIEQNMGVFTPPFELHDNTISPIENLISTNYCKLDIFITITDLMLFLILNIKV